MRSSVVALLILTSMPLFLALAAQQSNLLIIAGQAGSAKVIQVDGHHYVEIEGLSRLTNSSISFSGNQIVMTLPGVPANAPATPAPTAGFSKDFVTAGIEAMTRIRNGASR